MDAAAWECPVRCASAAATCNCQMTAMPSRASIDRASCSVRLWRRAIDRLRFPQLGDAIDLVARRAQAGNAIAVDVAFPGEKFIDREIIEAADLLDRNPAATHGFDDGRLAPYSPAFGQGRQIRYQAEQIVRRTITVGGIACGLLFHVIAPRDKGNVSALTLRIDCAFYLICSYFES